MRIDGVEIETVYRCPECGWKSLRKYRHLHSTTTPPYFRRVPLVEHKVGLRV